MIWNEEISKSKILDMVCAMRISDTVYEDSIERWLQSVVCELRF
jgi:hypothetical protein